MDPGRGASHYVLHRIQPLDNDFFNVEMCRLGMIKVG